MPNLEPRRHSQFCIHASRMVTERYVLAIVAAILKPVCKTRSLCLEEFLENPAPDQRKMQTHRIHRIDTVWVERQIRHQMETAQAIVALRLIGLFCQKHRLRRPTSFDRECLEHVESFAFGIAPEFLERVRTEYRIAVNKTQRVAIGFQELAR